MESDSNRAHAYGILQKIADLRFIFHKKSLLEQSHSNCFQEKLLLTFCEIVHFFKHAVKCTNIVLVSKYTGLRSLLLFLRRRTNNC